MERPLDLGSLLEGIPPDRVLFWTGAGISAPAPSSLPLGDELTREVVEACCLAGTWARMVELFEHFDVQDTSGSQRTAPRLEAILDGCVQALGTRALELLSGLAQAEPNPVHHFFAAHLESGGNHLTVNLDDCIERTGCRARALHLHGRYQPESLESLGARLAVVAHGLPPDTQQAIVEQLKRADVLIVCGYGGRDFFDVDPFFMNHAAFNTDDAIDLSCLRVLWLSHGQFHESRDEPFVSGTPAVGRAMLEALTRCGASPVIRRCNTESELRSLAAAWQLGWTTNSDPRETSWRTPLQDFRPSERERRWTTTTLWRAMSVGGNLAADDRPLEAQARLEWLDYQPRHRALEALYIARAHTGHYRQASATAREMRRRARFLAGVAEYRRAVAMRHSYRPFRAWMAHRLALRLTRSGEAQKPPQYYDIRLTYLSLHRELASRRLLRFVTSDAQARRIFAELSEAASYLGSHPHAVPQLRSAHSAIPALRSAALPPKLRSPDPLAFYSQSDNFLGPINDARNRLKAAGREQTVAAGDFLGLASRSQAIGDLPGELKALELARCVGRGVGRPQLRDLPFAALWRIEWAIPRKVGFVLRWMMPTLFASDPG